MTSRLHYATNALRGFTLVELMVTLVIIAILSSLSLAGLNGARQRSKIAKTQSTLRKLNEAITPIYHDFLRRRLVQSGSTASQRLSALRTVQALEMPDSWGDVAASSTAVNSHAVYARTGPIRAYAAFKQSCMGRTDEWGSAECLYLMIARSGYNASLLENFRTDEVFDIDRDNAPEFKDAWNTPIAFVRWAPGFSAGVAPNAAWRSPIQVADPSQFHDPFDSQRVDASGYALYPLIVSAGPDEEMQVVLSGTNGTGLVPWQSPPLSLTTVTGGSAGAAEDISKARDNLTNHDLIKR